MRHSHLLSLSSLSLSLSLSLLSLSLSLSPLSLSLSLSLLSQSIFQSGTNTSTTGCGTRCKAGTSGESLPSRHSMNQMYLTQTPVVPGLPVTIANLLFFMRFF